MNLLLKNNVVEYNNHLSASFSRSVLENRKWNSSGFYINLIFVASKMPTLELSPYERPFCVVTVLNHCPDFLIVLICVWISFEMKP